MQPRFAVTLAVGLGLGIPEALGSAGLARAADAHQTVAVSQAGETVVVSIQGLTLVSLSPSYDGMEAALSFRQPVAPMLAEDIRRLSPSFSDASSGYDSLLLRTQAVSRFEAVRTPGGFVLRISPATPANAGSRLAALDIRRLTLLDETQEARARLATLRRSQPDDVELLRLDADIDMADKEFRSAAGKYAALLGTTPDDDGLRQSLQSAQAGYAARVETGLSTRKIRNADRQTHGYAAAEIPVGASASLRGRIDYVELDDNDVQFADGSRGPFNGERVGGELDAMFDLGPRWHASLMGFANESSLGAGASFLYEDASSSVELKAVFQHPAWDYPESIVANGTVDAASLEITRSFDDIWFFNATGAYQRFTIAGISDAAINTAVETGIRARLYADDNSRIFVGYGFEADFVSRVSELPDGGSGTFALLPLDDRIVHSADLKYESQLADGLLASVHAGYASDAEGQDGPVAGAELTYEPAIDLKVSLTTYYSGIPDRAGQSGSFMNSGLTITRIFLPDNGLPDAK